jgi:hypothetical protein
MDALHPTSFEKGCFWEVRIITALQVCFEIMNWCWECYSRTIIFIFRTYK